MLITLTNANELFKGKKIMLNTDHMVSVHSIDALRESGETETITLVFCPPHGNWEVKETPGEVAEIIASSK